MLYSLPAWSDCFAWHHETNRSDSTLVPLTLKQNFTHPMWESLAKIKRDVLGESLHGGPKIIFSR